MLSYTDACTVGMGLILSATSFLIGVFYANQAYDYRILFRQDSIQSDFNDALKHYQILHKTPLPILIGLGTVAAVGLLGHLIRIYKPNPDLRNFEYGSLVLYFLGVCVCLSNVKTGVTAAVTHEWGDVTENQGLAVLASSNIILIMFLTGVIMLQGGLWYTRWEHQVRLKQFYEEEAREEAQRKKQNEASEAQEAQVHQEDLKEDAQKHAKGTLSEKAEEFVEKAKADPRVHQAKDYYEDKIKPAAKKHRDELNSNIRARRTRRKE